MKRISSAEFKAHCLQLMDEVNESGEPILVTKRGKVRAIISPPPDERKEQIRLGHFAHQVTIVGDIVGPIADPEEWEALR